MTLTLPQLLRVMRRLSTTRAAAMLPHLVAAMQEADISTPARAAAFLAQLAVESGELRWFEEIASGEAYEGRADLGNVHPGDGKRFKGRGPIQLTGRANYRKAGAALGLELEQNPELAARWDVGFRVAGWYWTSHNLNPLADAGLFRSITHLINGGLNHLSEREEYHRRAREVLGA